MAAVDIDVSQRPERKYEGIWKLVKNKGRCRVAAPAKDHQTIQRLVRKEKYIDLEWKAECEMQDKRINLRYKSDGDILTFWLDKRPSLGFL